MLRTIVLTEPPLFRRGKWEEQTYACSWPSLASTLIVVARKTWEMETRGPRGGVQRHRYRRGLCTAYNTDVTPLPSMKR